MSALVGAFQQYLELLILGGLALALWGIVFRRPVVREWHQAFTKFMPNRSPAAKGRTDADSALTTEQPEPANVTLSVALEWGILLAICYVFGFTVNTMSYSALQWAHVDVICSVSKYLADDGSGGFDLEPRSHFFLLPLSLAHRSPEETCARAYRTDNRRQVDWQIDHRESYDEAVDALVRQMRLIRGFVLLSILFVFLCTLRFVYDLLSSMTRHRDLRNPPSLALVGRWLLFSGLSISIYLVAMLMYWNIEANFHEQVFASEPLSTNAR